MNAKPETAAYRAAFAPTDALSKRRGEAFARFEELGFPTRRDEAWRFTNLRPLQDKPFAPATGRPKTVPALEPYFFAGETYRIVLANGRFAAPLSKIGGLPQGVT